MGNRLALSTIIDPKEYGEVTECDHCSGIRSTMCLSFSRELESNMFVLVLYVGSNRFLLRSRDLDRESQREDTAKAFRRRSQNRMVRRFHLMFVSIV